jgi:hypothetical protein
VFVSSIEVRLLIDATRTPQDRLNWKSTAHWNAFAAGQRTAPIWLDTRQVSARHCSFCRARQHGIDFARQSNEHCLARQLRNRYPAWLRFLVVWFSRFRRMPV